MSSSATSGADTFHTLLSQVDPPMVIVTCVVDDERTGCLVGFTTQCSIHPPRYLVCVSHENHTYDLAMRADVLAVHVLDEDDIVLARVFGSLTGDDVDKLALVDWVEGPDGVPVLVGAAGWFAGRVLDRHDVGDHTAVVLEPIAGEQRRPLDPPLGYQSMKDVDPGHPA
ncbi:MAG: hypothetical protein V7636_2731 [Actinomycetota bacterium]|jgi:flavin reductase (DIM6/NTAB) family NADH-FMN oxidoreductase RutF